jgi:hypothetical protein
VQKNIILFLSSVLVTTLLFGGGFLFGRFTTDKRTITPSTEYSWQVGRIIELTREYITTRQRELGQREESLKRREAYVTSRERLIREAEARAKADRADLGELEHIISEIIRLTEKN